MKKLLIALMAITTLLCLTFAACGGKGGGKEETPETYTVTISVNEATYGTVSKASIENVAKGTAVAVSGNVLTVGEETVTATATAATAQYTYAFTGFTGTAATVTGNIEITANFSRTVNKYTVTFEMGDGTAIDPIEVDYGASVSELDDISVTAPAGYHFVKWQLKTGTDTYVDFDGTETLEEDITVKAIYEPDVLPQYTVTINMDGGALSDGENDDITSLTVDQGTQASELDAYTKTKTGYEFSKWQYFDGENYVDLPANATVTGDITLKAVWTVDYVLSLNEDAATLYNDTTNGAGSFASVAGLNATFSVTPALSVTPAETVSYSYESDDTDVATVTNAGVISAVGGGNATITVTATDGNTGETQQETIEITVKNYIELSTKAEFTAAIRGEADAYFLMTADFSYSEADYADTNGGNHDAYLFYNNNGEAASIYGVLDGNGHKLTVSRPGAVYEYYRSTFYWIIGTVRNLYIDVTVTGSAIQAGGFASALAYRIHNDGLVENCIIAHNFVSFAGVGDTAPVEDIYGTMRNCVTYDKPGTMGYAIAKYVREEATVEDIVHIDAWSEWSSYNSYSTLLPSENEGTVTNMAWYGGFSDLVNGTGYSFDEEAYAAGYDTNANSPDYWPVVYYTLSATDIVSGFTFTSEGVSFS